MTGRVATPAVVRAWFTEPVICGSHAASKKHPAPTARATRHLRFPIPPSHSGVASLGRHARGVATRPSSEQPESQTHELPRRPHPSTPIVMHRPPAHLDCALRRPPDALTVPSHTRPAGRWSRAWLLESGPFGPCAIGWPSVSLTRENCTPVWRRLPRRSCSGGGIGWNLRLASRTAARRGSSTSSRSSTRSTAAPTVTGLIDAPASPPSAITQDLEPARSTAKLAGVSAAWPDRPGTTRQAPAPPRRLLPAVAVRRVRSGARRHLLRSQAAHHADHGHGF